MQRAPSGGDVCAAPLPPRALAGTPPASPARTSSSSWLPRSPGSGLQRPTPQLRPRPNDGWGPHAWESEGGEPAPAAAVSDGENAAPHEAAELSPRALASPGGPLRSLSGNALQLRRAPSADKEASACVSPPAACTPKVGLAPSPASLPAPSTGKLPRGARLMRLGLTVPSPTKVAGASSRGLDDGGARQVAACVAAALVATLLSGAAVSAFRRRRADGSTALVPWNAAASADQARRMYPVGQAMLLPFLLPPSAAWSSCGTAPAMGLPALPSTSAPTALMMQPPGELALASVAAVGRAYSALTELAAGTNDVQMLTIGVCVLLLVAIVLVRVFARSRADDDAVDLEMEPEEEMYDDLLVTPQSGIGEYSDFTYDEVDSDVAALPEGELRDSWPLVSTPAVTRLLSFSRAASPAGSMRTSIGYGSALPAPASAQNRRSRRLAGRDATVAQVGVPPPTRGSVQRLRGGQQH